MFATKNVIYLCKLLFMRFINITLFILLLGSASVFAQFNLAVSSSYAIRSNPTLITSASDFGVGFTTLTETTSLHSFGAGVRLNVDFSYTFKKPFIIGLQSSYLLGRKFEQKSSFQNSVTSRTEFQGRSIQFQPYLAYEIKDIRFPLQFGIGMAVANNQMIQTTRSEDLVFYDETELTIDGKWNIGAHAFGRIIFPIRKSFSLFGEISMIQMSMETKSGEITKYIANGQNLISQISDENRFIEFSRTTVDPINNPENNTVPAQRYPFSSVNFGFGLRFSF